MQEASTRRIYDWQCAVYDKTFGRLVLTRIAKAIRSHLALRPGHQVLDLGVGTGNSLHNYPPEAKVFGIDLSRGMLDKCRDKIADQGLGNVAILQGNALRLPFADSTFDRIFISHVISVVSDPASLLREAQRVAKPNARIVILNHFMSSNPVIAWIERLVSPLCSKVGWRSDLCLADILQQTGIEVDYRFKLERIDLWETVVICNSKPDHGRLERDRADERRLRLPVLAT